MAGLIAVLGAAELAVETLAEVPIAVPTTKAVWHGKVLLLIAIFVYAFFKFAWAFRLTNNCSILIGAAPAAPADPARAEAHAERAAAIIGLAAFHLNRGFRGYFFALAALAWFLHPAIFTVVSTWVVLVLYRRDFRSRALRAVRAAEEAAPPLNALRGPVPMPRSARATPSASASPRSRSKNSPKLSTAWGEGRGFAGRRETSPLRRRGDGVLKGVALGDEADV